MSQGQVTLHSVEFEIVLRNWLERKLPIFFYRWLLFSLGPYFFNFTIYLKYVKIKQSDICIHWKSKRVFLLVFTHYRASRRKISAKSLETFEPGKT